MNSKAHALTTHAAIAALPAWERELWQPETKPLAESYSLFGDTYPLCKAEIGPYIEFPDGSIPDFYVPKLRWKHHVDAAVDVWEIPFFDSALKTLTYFSERIVEAMRRNDIGAAARFAGTMAHYFQDNACPGHAMDETDLEIVKDLLPPPAHLKHNPFHSMMETSPPPFSLGDYAPRLYGTTVSQAACNFIDRLLALILHARKAVLPFFEAFYRHDAGRAAELNAAICRFAAEVFADYLHTLAGIAFARFESEALQSLSVKRLAGTLPYRQTAWAPGPYAQVGPGDLSGVNLNEAYDAVPCELMVPGTNPSSNRICLTDALGATAYFEYDFKVASGIYDRFRTDYGVHAVLGASHALVFEIYCHDRCLFRDVRRSGETAGTVCLPWPADGERLRLVTTVDPEAPIQRINGRPIVLVGHAVWGRPRLERAAGLGFCKGTKVAGD